MAEPDPATELSAFSSANATPTEWPRARDELADAEVYWLSTVRPDGRPHVTPLLGVWLEGALYFCTGANERKAKNLSVNSHCVLTTGQSTLDGLDLVIEGTAEGVSDHVELGHIASTYESKYGPHFVAPDGTWSGRRRHSTSRGSGHRVASDPVLDLAKGERSAKHAGGFQLLVPVAGAGATVRRPGGNCETTTNLLDRGRSGTGSRSTDVPSREARTPARCASVGEVSYRRYLDRKEKSPTAGSQGGAG